MDKKQPFHSSGVSSSASLFKDFNFCIRTMIQDTSGSQQSCWTCTTHHHLVKLQQKNFFFGEGIEMQQFLALESIEKNKISAFGIC